MKINNIIFITTLLFAINSNAQIDKGNWMMGGSGSFGSFNTTSQGINNKGTYLNLNPNIGYFFIDKLAIGAGAELIFQTKFDTGLGISPFIRYYFLNKEKNINLFSELSYKVTKSSGVGSVKFETLNMKAGTVFFLNSSVGIEVAINYSNLKSNYELESNNIFLSVGFQIHLKRE